MVNCDNQLMKFPKHVFYWSTLFTGQSNWFITFLQVVTHHFSVAYTSYMVPCFKVLKRKLFCKVWQFFFSLPSLSCIFYSFELAVCHLLRVWVVSPENRMIDEVRELHYLCIVLQWLWWLQSLVFFIYLYYSVTLWNLCSFQTEKFAKSKGFCYRWAQRVVYICYDFALLFHEWTKETRKGYSGFKNLYSR